MTTDTNMILTGDQNVPAMPLTDAQVNHLRRLLAWMRVEYCLDESMQIGCLGAVQYLTASGHITPDQGSKAIAERAVQINRVPKYLRQGIKMLTKALREHEARSGVVDAEETLDDLVSKITPENRHDLVFSSASQREGE